MSTTDATETAVTDPANTSAPAEIPETLASTPSPAGIGGYYTIDPSHTRIGFSARHAMVTKVRGSFRDFEGSAHVDTDNPSASSVRIVIETASLNTGNDQRDGHLRSPDFFDAESNPEITFTSTEVSRKDTDWTITGDLAIGGVTKPVTIVFEETGAAKDPFGNERIGFEGSVTVNRSDWGLRWNAALEAGGVLVSEKVTLEFDVSAIRNQG